MTQLRLYEEFTPRAQQVVAFAEDEARALAHPSVGTEHILLGVIRAQEGLAARVLESFGMTMDRVRGALEVPAASDHAHGSLTGRAESLLARAPSDALAMGDEYVGTTHLLLALVADSEGAAAQVLLRLGTNPDRVRDLIWMHLSRADRDRGAGPLGHEDALVDGAGTLLYILANDVEAHLGRSADSGDLVVALACVSGAVVQEMFASIGLDPAKLVKAADAARAKGTRSQLLPGTETLAQVEELREQQLAAVRRRDFTTAAQLRARHRKVWREALGAASDSQLDLLKTVAGHLGIAD